jgi:hypothetical protein
MSFWAHSLATALISERVAKRIGRINTDEAFLAGLLHDFGILLLDEFFPTIFRKLLEETTKKGSRFIDIERKVLKITRNDIIKELFEAWKIPDNITNAIAGHYSIGSESKKSDAAQDDITVCTHMGNILAKTLCIGAVCDQYVTPLDNDIFKKAKMPTGLGKDFYEGIMVELNKYREFLNIKEDEVETEKDIKHIGIFSTANHLFIPVEEYFKIQGHEVVRIPESESYTEFDKQFDAIFVWTDASTTWEKVSSLGSILQKVDEEKDEGGDPSKAPVCICIYPDSPLAGDEAGKFSRMYNEFDLRQLDENLYTMLSNEIVPLQPLGTTPVPSETQVQPKSPEEPEAESTEPESVDSKETTEQVEEKPAQ